MAAEVELKRSYFSYAPSVGTRLIVDLPVPLTALGLKPEDAIPPTKTRRLLYEVTSVEPLKGRAIQITWDYRYFTGEGYSRARRIP